MADDSYLSVGTVTKDNNKDDTGFLKRSKSAYMPIVKYNGHFNKKEENSSIKQL